MDQQLQDGIDSARTWLAVVEYSMIALVALLFLTVLLLFVMLWQLLKIRDELPKHQHTHVTIQPEAPKPEYRGGPRYSSSFVYNTDVEREADKRESREH